MPSRLNTLPSELLDNVYGFVYGVVRFHNLPKKYALAIQHDDCHYQNCFFKNEKWRGCDVWVCGLIHDNKFKACGVLIDVKKIEIFGDDYNRMVKQHVKFDYTYTNVYHDVCIVGMKIPDS